MIDRVEIVLNGRVVNSSQNLRGLRRYASGINAVGIRAIIMQPQSSGFGGKLTVLFQNGAHCVTTFASYDVMCDWVLNWRNASDTKKYYLPA